MTELEKSMNNCHANVDLNELIKELRAANEAYIRDMEKQAESDFDAFDKAVDIWTALKPAVLAVHTFNTVLTRVGMTDAILPFLLAGFGVLYDSLTEQLSTPSKMMLKSTKDVLSERITTVSVKVPRKAKGEA